MKNSSLVIPPAVGFLGLTAVMAAIALAHRAGSIDSTLQFRGIGACVGLMTLLAGNFLPKLRPLASREGRVLRIASAERRAGWMLVLMGVALVGISLFAPVGLARVLTPVVALAGVGWIELDWIWTAWISRPTPGEEAVSRTGGEQRVIGAWMLFGLAYILVTASLKLMITEPGWVRDLGAWMVIGFTFAYALMQVLLHRRRRPS